ncbi:MAG: hypothetical protein KAX49_16785 [Halanaerobiales bacterium]|nr:hypothetical protein [Halanaerobiales bacterium]
MAKDPKELNEEVANVKGPEEENNEATLNDLDLTKKEVFEELDKAALRIEGIGPDMETCCDTGLL